MGLNSMATYGYRRVSSQGQEEGASLEVQAERINAMAVLAGLDAPTLFTDVCSGSVPLDRRAGGGAMIESLRPGDSIIVAKLDRCFRDAGDALTRADWFRDQGINLYLIDMGAEPVTQNGTSRMFFGMLALVAEFERTRIRERLAEGRTAKRAKGGFIGGPRPFGYDVEGTGRDAVLIERADEQEAIALMKQLRAQGESFRSIAVEVERRNFNVSHVTVRKILANA